MVARMLSALVIVLILATARPGHASAAVCREIADEPHFLLNTAGDAALDKINYSRADVFAAIHFTSLRETGGCWGGATGNVDGQILSVGALQ